VGQPAAPTTGHRCRRHLQSILPGVTPPEHKEAEIRVYQDLNKQALAPFMAARRLGSPQHYRYYYAFSQPSGALPDVEVAHFIETAARSPEDALPLFNSLSTVARPQGGNAAEVLMDRLVAIGDRIPGAAVSGILRAFAETMDTPAFSEKVGGFGVRIAWEVAKRLVELLLPRISGCERKSVLDAMFGGGRAIGWLTHLLRGEIFAHGRFGDRATPPDRWLLTAEEFDGVLSTMLQRYRQNPAAELIQVPDFFEPALRLETRHWDRRSETLGRYFYHEQRRLTGLSVVCSILDGIQRQRRLLPA
jgi:hypothetical protein